MYLKSLELQGFKSFPDRTVIRFSDGMTAIVGPNGSGKSNISDAIRWVLGEQSTRSLRGAKMEDVVFGGTAKRSPMGAARVTLILDNSAGQFPVDATEVMVTRKYFRSGESEYYLNRKRVRLRDIREVFMDTGLGHDGYSIIGQGRIDEILATKSTDRREVFEEAAGVTRFRTRKDEAERKLNETADNLIRIQDIWRELDTRSGPLEQQAKNASEYLHLRDQLRVHEVSVWMDTLDGIKEMKEKSDRDCRQAGQQLEIVRQQQQEQYACAERLAEDMRQSDMQAEQLQAELTRTEEKSSALLQRMAVLQETHRNAAENITLTKGQLDAQKEQADALDQQLQARHKRLYELEYEIKQKTADWEAKQQKIEQVTAQIHSEQQQTVDLRQQVDAISQSMFAVQADQRSIQMQLEELEGRNKTVGEDVRSAQARTEQEEAAQRQMQEELDALRKRIAAAEHEQVDCQQHARAAGQKLTEARERHRKQMGMLTDIRNRIHILTELQREYEGFSRAVKLVMNQASSGALHGVRGPLSSLIEVSDRYVMAVETALGAAASHIIVQRADDGKKAIELLKRRDSGRATFLPMDTIRPQSLHESGLERQNGFCGIAADLVDCEADYRDIVENILGRTVVAENMDYALAMARQYHHRFRIVTLDGQVIHAGGSMTGGSANRSSGILSRANQLAQLQQTEQKYEHQLQELEQTGRQLAEQFGIANEAAEQAAEQLVQLRQKLAAVSAQLQQHRILLDSIRQTEQQFRAEQTNAQQQKQELRRKHAKSEQQAAEQARERQNTVRKLHQASGQVQELTQTLNTWTEAASQLRTALAQAQTERETVGQALTDLQQMADATRQTAAEHRRRIDEYEEASQQAQVECRQLEQASENNRLYAEQLRSQLQACGQNRLRLEQNKTEAEKQARYISNEIIGLERKHAEVQAAAQRVHSEEQRILDKMWESYELTPTAARQVAQPVTHRQDEEKQAEKLRKSIKALGPVNLAAIEEYRELSERLIFLTEQKNDLEQAQTELRSIIGQLTEQMKRVFATSFAQLNQYFGETFREIFGGGSAELVLEDEQDILGCGIEIRVTPPGKSLKNLSLLSGGEKAFVAIALYFAILKVRPTPFCVLDEIEAALDDVNVTRFAQYLRRLSDKTQFIVITHRRGTMEEADMLYGVTMQERGVSKLLMLNIADVEQEMKIELT